jgi:regulator of RNase E activity RraA
LTFVGWQEPIGCGGVAVFPNDVLVADGDGAVLIPAALLDAVVAASLEQERLEAWIMEEVNAGAALPGLYLSAKRGKPPALRGLGRQGRLMPMCRAA